MWLIWWNGGINGMRNVQIEKWEKENEKGNVDGIVVLWLDV